MEIVYTLQLPLSFTAVQHEYVISALTHNKNVHFCRTIWGAIVTSYVLTGLVIYAYVVESTYARDCSYVMESISAYYRPEAVIR